MKIRTSCIGLFLFFIGATGAFAQDSEKVLKREIERLKKEIQEEKQKHAEELEREKSFENSAGKRLKDADNQLYLIRVQSDSLKSEVGKLEKSNRSLAGAARHYENKRKKYGEFLAQLADSLAENLLKKFPFEAESHATNLKSVASGLRSGAIPPEEGMSRTWAVLISRFKKGFESEIYSASLEENGVEIPGKYLRFGQALMLFHSSDGKKLSFLQKEGANYVWTDLPEDMQMRLKFKEVFEVMEGKRPPALVQVPIGVQLDEGGVK